MFMKQGPELQGPGLARLSFQERKVMRTCATAVDKQYELTLRSAVSVYHSLKKSRSAANKHEA